MEELIIKAKNGDRDAYTELIHFIQNDLYRIAKTRLSDDNDICDAIQETIIKTYNKIKKLKDNSKFKGWIIKILINECNLIYKKKKKQENIYEKIKNSNADYNDKFLYDIESKMDFDLLISKLDYDERLIITLYYNSGFSCSEIARILSMNINTVKSKLTRSKTKIAKYNQGGVLHE